MRKHRDLAELYGEAPAAIETAIEGFNKQVGVVTAHLRDQTYLLDDHFTGADILLTSVLTWAANYGFALDPVLQRYVEKQISRPAYKRAAKLKPWGLARFQFQGHRQIAPGISGVRVARQIYKSGLVINL